MADRLSALKARLAKATDRVVSEARRRAFWMALAAATLGVVTVAGVVGSSARLRAEEWRVRAGELHATREAAAMWRRELVEPNEAEEAGWQASQGAVRERGIDPADRLALLQEVAQGAEDLGIADVSVSFESSDTLGSTEVREVGEAVFEVSPWAVGVRFVAEYGTVGSFVASLPPQVDVHRLRMTRLDAGVEAELLLIVFAGGGS